MWVCPLCHRTFTRINQRHRCGTGQPEEVTQNRSAFVVELYQAIATFVNQLGPVETVARDRYVLFRSQRIFTDLSIMKDAVRVAIHLGRQVQDPVFIKIVADAKQATHVAKIVSLDEFMIIQPFIKEAYLHSLTSSTV